MDLKAKLTGAQQCRKEGVQGCSWRRGSFQSREAATTTMMMTMMMGEVVVVVMQVFLNAKSGSLFVCAVQHDTRSTPWSKKIKLVSTPITLQARCLWWGHSESK